MGGIEFAPHASYSSFSSYLQCGERYRLERVAKVTQLPAWYLVGGNAVHTATEMYDLGQGTDAGELFDEAFTKKAVEEEEASGTDRDKWRAGGRATKEWPNKADQSWWIVNGPVMVQNWINWRANSGWQIWETPAGLPAVEVAMTVTMNEVPVKMFVDRVMVDGAGRLFVVDIKTGGSEPENHVQLGLYACGLELVFDMRPQMGAFWMARKGVIPDEYDLEHLTPALMGAWIHDWDQARRSGIFIPHPTRLCRACGVRDYCAAVGGEKAGSA